MIDYTSAAFSLNDQVVELDNVGILRFGRRRRFQMHLDTAATSGLRRYFYFRLSLMKTPMI